MHTKDNGQQMRVLIIAAEAVPFAKTGQVSEVVASLAAALAKLGHDVRVAMPRYEHVDPERFGLEAFGETLSVPMADRQDEATAYRLHGNDGVTYYMIDNPRHYGPHVTATFSSDAEPFIFFGRALLEMLRAPWFGWKPDIVHCHDWQAAIVPNWLATIFADDPAFAGVGTVFTIHRLSHQGIFGYRVLEVAGIREFGYLYHSAISDLGEMVDFMARGIYYSDAVTTVSESYAREIQTPEFGERLDPLIRDRGDRLFGILNGIDAEAYNPATDSTLASNYDADHLVDREPNKAALQEALRLPELQGAPIIGMVSRLADDKGLGLLQSCLDGILQNTNAQLAVIGVGEPQYHEMFSGYVRRYPRRVAAQFTFDDALERQLYAGSDLFLMPSLVEPCGLGHMLAMRYGSVPVVHATGGLADTVIDYAPRQSTSSGFSFPQADGMALYTAIIRAIEIYKHKELWRPLQERCMRLDYSWNTSAQIYVDVYRWALAMHAQLPRPKGGWVG